MTYVLALSDEVKRNELLYWAVMMDSDIGNMFWATFDFKNSEWFQYKESN